MFLDTLGMGQDLIEVFPRVKGMISNLARFTVREAEGERRVGGLKVLGRLCTVLVMRPWVHQRFQVSCDRLPSQDFLQRAIWLRGDFPGTAGRSVSVWTIMNVRDKRSSCGI